MPDFKNHVIAITGATGGIGRATAKEIVGRGGRVAVSDLDPAKVKALIDELGESAVGLAVDVTDLTDNQSLMDLAEQSFGQLNGVFLNAGIEGQVAPFEKQSESAWQDVFDINFHGVRWGVQAALPALERAGGGSIVMTSSVAGLRGAPGLCPYVASKHALIGLMRSLASELGPKGIRVNTLNPGPVDNRMMRSIEEQSKPGHGMDVKQAFTSRIPMGRYVTNEECAHMAAFLLGDLSAGVSGNTYLVDGGYCAG